MKIKLFLLSFVCILSLSLKAQDTTVKTLPDTAKLTIGKVYSDVKEGLKGLGSALKVGSEHVYSVLVKQQIVQAVTDLILILIVITTAFPLFKLLKYICQHDDLDEIFGVLVFSVFLCIGWVVVVVIGLAHINQIVTGFVNPEYGALKDIMDFVHPTKSCN